MKRILVAILLVIAVASPVFAQRKRKTVADEKRRFQTLLGYIKTSDVPARIAATREMIAFTAEQMVRCFMAGRGSAQTH